MTQPTREELEKLRRLKELEQKFNSVTSFVRGDATAPTQREMAEAQVRDMGGWERARAGAAEFFNDKWTGVKQLAPSVLALQGLAPKEWAETVPDWVPTREDVDARRELTAPLMETPQAKAGYIGAGITTATGTSMVPGANTIPGAGIVGSLWGFTEPVGADDSRMRNAYVGGVLGMGSQFLANSIGNYFRGKSANLRSQQGANASEDIALKEAINEGYKVPPSYANRSPWYKRLLETISGKYKTNQLARISNQSTTNRLAAEALGLPGDTALNPGVLGDVRDAAFINGYQPVRQSGRIVADSQFIQSLTSAKSGNASFPDLKSDIAEGIAEKILYKQTPNGKVAITDFDAGDIVDAIKYVRNESTKAFKAGDNNTGYALKDIASALEDQIERHLNSLGQSGADILENYRLARQLIAVSHSVEASMNMGNYNVNALQLASQLRRGVPLSGNLEKIAKFGSAFKDSAASPSSGNANNFTIFDAAGATASIGTGNPGMTGMILARPLARATILSGPMQRGMSVPHYDYSPLAKALGGRLERAGAMIPLAGLPFISN